MDREYTVDIGGTKRLVTVRQIGARSWLATATHADGEKVEFTGDNAEYAVTLVTQALEAAA